MKRNCCNTLYELDPEIGKRIARGEELEIMPDNLTKVNIQGYANTYKKCSNCGYETREDFGCEGRPDGLKPKCKVILRDFSGNEMDPVMPGPTHFYRLKEYFNLDLNWEKKEKRKENRWL